MSNLANIQQAVADATRFIQATWQQTVMGAMRLPGVPEIRANVNLRKIYADSIILGQQLNTPTAIRGIVLATSSVASDLENGKGPWDMKPGLLGGPKARVSKNGTRYNIIPFRHAVPGGTSNTAVGRTMPQSIYKKARELRAGQQLRGTERAFAPGQNKTTGYQHKNGPYEGMQRIEKTYERATQSKYLTFRLGGEEFGLDIPDEDADKMKTVGDAMKYLQEHASA